MVSIALRFSSEEELELYSERIVLDLTVSPDMDGRVDGMISLGWVGWVAVIDGGASDKSRLDSQIGRAHV